MNDENTQFLYNKYPRLFFQHSLSPQQTCMCWGFEFGDGWFHIIDQLCEKLEAAYQKIAVQDQATALENYRIEGEPDDLEYVNQQVQLHYTVAQAKEKFGGLRFYMSGQTDEMSEAILEAEALSRKTCEGCGKPGELRTGGWLVTECEACWRKTQEDRAKRQY